MNNEKITTGQWVYELPYGRVCVTFSAGVWTVKAHSPLWSSTLVCRSGGIAHEEAAAYVAKIQNIVKVREKKHPDTNINLKEKGDNNECNVPRGRKYAMC